MPEVSLHRRHPHEEDESRWTYEQLLELDRNNVRRGLRAKELSRLECRKVEMSDPKMHCQICMSDGCPGEMVTTLPCKHEYHQGCITKWLKALDGPATLESDVDSLVRLGGPLRAQHDYLPACLFVEYSLHFRGLYTWRRNTVLPRYKSSLLLSDIGFRVALMHWQTIACCRWRETHYSRRASHMKITTSRVCAALRRETSCCRMLDIVKEVGEVDAELGEEEGARDTQNIFTELLHARGTSAAGDSALRMGSTWH
ncbi:hypothetical protein CBR_g39824 [Chara braunii]|uniref:RING-type domain-containing protein n=1 Tax=Chara braunii TaxID=69332 RepID=A0A388LSE6_CHABU|nr:hypothetical protein CBR_g39824 [Chara braunii]|eukprot:GBG85258.1 hypothetical protein CBR_g39824 [Chara braunii]